MSRRLDAIPGVGPALATALVASVADPKAFRSGRNFSAWIGLVPPICEVAHGHWPCGSTQGAKAEQPHRVSRPRQSRARIWLRYPPRFEIFKPVCRTSELWKCSHEALVNTYDNTILYTDHVVAEQIRLLGSVSASVDSLLIYVSDHGESLGEHGLYLHGTPYAFAPQEQTRVPFLMDVRRLSSTFLGP